MDYIVKILDTHQVTHDVRRFRLEKPDGYVFNPGQATDVSVNKPEWKEERRPFTFTCLATDPYLEFTIKRYPDHHGVTDQLHQLQPGDELIVRDVWGAIEYKGPGYFVAGGAGITPFLAILRHLHQEKTAGGNTLFFSNKTSSDVIEEQQLREILGDKVHFLLSRDDNPAYLHGRINADFLKQHITDFKQPFYICGPDQMIQEINGLLTGMGASSEALVFEK